MPWILTYPTISLCYGFLYLAVLSLWFPGKRTVPNWGLGLILATLFGWYSNQLDWSALVSLLLFAVAAYYSQAKKTTDGRRVLATFTVIFLSCGLASHQLPGFNGLLVLDHVYLSTAALPYSLYLNFDKAVIGILILGLGGPVLIRSQKEMLLTIKQILPSILMITLGIMVLALVLGLVRFEPKLSSHVFIWALTNLLFTCVAEEALFRGFIQKKLTLMLGNRKNSSYTALIIAACLFGLAHYTGGKSYVLLATMAGLGYGWVYQKTRRIEASILTHFSLNLIHFLFFTYPALA